MKSASNRSKYRYNPCKRRRPSFENNKNNNTSTLNSGDSSSGVSDYLDNNMRRSSLKREKSLDKDSSSVINAPLNFDSTLTACTEKLRTDLIFNPVEVRLPIKEVTRVEDVTDGSHSAMKLYGDTVSSSCGEEGMDLDDNNLLYDTIPQSTPAEKEARRVKRRLQLEQWRQYELNRARNERYHNRLKRKHGHPISFAEPSRQQKTIKWKKDLVQIFLVDCDTQA